MSVNIFSHRQALAIEIMTFRCDSRNQSRNGGRILPPLLPEENRLHPTSPEEVGHPLAFIVGGGHHCMILTKIYFLIFQFFIILLILKNR